MYATLNVRKASKKPTEFKYTTSEDKLFIIKKKMFIFKHTWGIIKDTKVPQRKTTFWEVYQKKVKSTDYADDVIATEILDMVYLQPERVRLLRAIEDILWELTCGKDNEANTNINKTDMMLSGSENSYEKAFIQYVMVKEDVRSVETINTKLNQARQCLYLIGREYEWKHGGRHINIAFGDVQVPLGDVCNPITNAMKKVVKDSLEGLGRSGKFTVIESSKAKVKTETSHASDDELSDDSDVECDTKTKTIHSNSLPVNIAVTHHIVMKIFGQLLDMVHNNNDTRRMVNLANLLIVTLFVMHEGCRPCEVILTQKHRDMTFWLKGIQFPLIVLAFVKPETLTFLLESNELSRYSVDFWKGKRLQQYRTRTKSWIPTAYNTLDLATLYIIVIRMLACVDLDGITNRVINTDDKKKVAKKFKEVVNEMGIQFLALYGIRYASAEEDNKLGISVMWTRYRMGHTKLSLMPLRYANRNLNQRVVVDDNMTLLGCDVNGDRATDDSVLPLFFKKEEGKIPRNGEDVPLYMIDELLAVKNALAPLLTGTTKTNLRLRTLAESGKLYIASDKRKLFQDFKSMTIGSEFVFADKLIPTSTSYRKNVELQYNKVHSYFKEYSGPNVDKLMLWSYPQIMFGEFNTKLHNEANRNSHTLFAEEHARIDAYESLAIELGTVPDKLILKRRNCDTVQEMVDQGIKAAIENDKPTKKRKVSSTKHSEKRFIEHELLENEEPDLPYDFLEVGDIVAILCKQPDALAMPITMKDNTIKYVWIAKVTKHIEHQDGSYTIYGRFLYNTTLILTDPLSLSKKDTVVCSAVRDVLRLFVDEPNFTLNETDIELLREAIMQGNSA